MICHSTMVTIPLFPMCFLYLLYLMKMKQLRLARVLFQNFDENIPQGGHSARDEIPLTSQGFTASISLHVNFSRNSDGKLVFTYLLNIEYLKFYKKKVNCFFYLFKEAYIFWHRKKFWSSFVYICWAQKPQASTFLPFIAMDGKAESETPVPCMPKAMSKSSTLHVPGHVSASGTLHARGRVSTSSWETAQKRNALRPLVI